MGQIEGALDIYQNAGAPSNGVNEVQTITPSAVPDSGTFKLKYEGYETAALDFDASAAEMQTALNAIPSIGAGGVAVALDGGTGVYTVTFSGANLAKRALALISVVSNEVLDSSADPVTLTVAESVAGVLATCLGAAPGALLMDTTNKVLYVNTGTAAAPTWSVFVSGVLASAAELNLIDGSVAGTAVASKAAVLGANKNLDVLAIADLKLGAGAGTSIVPTAAQINLLLQAVAAGKKVAHGVCTVDAASKDVVTGLTTVEAVIVSMVGDPTMTHMFSSGTVGDQAGAPAAGSIRIKSWKPTAANDVTPIAAASVFGNVAWIAIGT